MKQGDKFSRVEVVYGQPLMHCSLDGVSHSAEAASKLILELGEMGIE